MWFVWWILILSCLSKVGFPLSKELAGPQEEHYGTENKHEVTSNHSRELTKGPMKGEMVAVAAAKKWFWVR